MKIIAFLVFLSFQSILGSSQTLPDSLESLTSKVVSPLCDTCISYINKDSLKRVDQDYVVEIGNILYSSILLKCLDVKKLRDVDLIKNTVLFNSKTYKAKLRINFIEEYKPKLISLSQLVSNYLKANDVKYIVSIDDEIIDFDYSQCFIDRNYVSTVYSETIEFVKSIDKMIFVSILTKGAEKLKKPIKVMIH